jgi:putative acetyltransferase
MSGQGGLCNSQDVSCSPKVQFRCKFDEGPEMPQLNIIGPDMIPSPGLVALFLIHTVTLSIMQHLLLDNIDPSEHACRMNQRPSQTLFAETAGLVISPLSNSTDARAFRELNEEWISKLFSLEDADRLILGDPQAEIIDKGGQVLLARADGVVVGCVALVAAGEGVFELSKMTVSPSLRGRGLGRAIVLAAIGTARELGASTLFLGSSTKLANAVKLYESVGFRHVPLDELGPLPYRRADVFMKYEL